MWVDEPQLSERVTRKASCLFLGRKMSVVSFIMGEGYLFRRCQWHPALGEWYLFRKISVVSCIGGGVPA